MTGRVAQYREPEARLFVAVPLPAPTCAAIESVVDRVRERLAAADADTATRGGAPGGRVRWVRMDGLHLTLRFLGGTAEEHLAALSRAVDAAAAGTSAFEVAVDGAGAFPSPARPRALWLAIVAGGDALTDLAVRLDEAVVEEGWPHDDRPFRAHLTLARTDGVRAGPLAARELAAAAAGLNERFVADRIVLFRSHLGGGPARYEPLHEAELGADDCRGVSGELGFRSPATAARAPSMAIQHSKRTRFTLDEDRIPRAWYNIAADLPEPAPPVLHPGTGNPIGPGDLAPLFPMELIKQVVSQDREIGIPDPVRDAYALYRPSPLHRAWRLEKALDTPAHIYYKYEGGSPSGSHKPNTALAQAFYNKEEGVTRLATETGAGQWGSALAFAGAVFGLDVKVYMVRSSYDQKPYRRVLMETYGAEVVASPSPDTNYGRSVLAEKPDHTGSLGVAISEAIEDTVTHPGTKYSLGSVFDFVLLHQTVIGQESIEQMAMAGEEPDVIIGCAGGGSNFAGLTFPWLGRTFREGARYRIIAAEPEAAPSLTRGVYAYDFGDTAKMTPLVKMHTLGSGFIPEPIHAGGLRYHGMSPLVSLLKDRGSIEARSVHQLACFDAGVRFARAEGILPAPEPTHAIKVAIDEAIEAREAGESRVILFNLCGHGHFDVSAYQQYLGGTLEDYEYPAAAVEAALASLPRM